MHTQPFIIYGNLATRFLPHCAFCTLFMSMHCPGMDPTLDLSFLGPAIKVQVQGKASNWLNNIKITNTTGSGGACVFTCSQTESHCSQGRARNSSTHPRPLGCLRVRWPRRCCRRTGSWRSTDWQHPSRPSCPSWRRRVSWGKPGWCCCCQGIAGCVQHIRYVHSCMCCLLSGQPRL